jgi:3-hydroxybutyryl-CoA dehydratase
MPFAIGQQFSFSRTITEQVVLAFAEISGDKNPLYLDEEYARQTQFGARIAHGALTLAVISAAMGNGMPGAVYLSQTLEFLKPAFIGDTLTATAEVTAIRADKGLLILKTDCVNQRGEKIAQGQAVAFHEKVKVENQVAH